MKEALPKPESKLKHFLKEIVQNPIYDTKGKAVSFEPLSEGYGVIALSLESEQDREWIATLEDCSRKRIGGVVPISAEEYSKKKKSLPFTPSFQESPLRVFQTSQPHQPVRVSSVAGKGEPGAAIMETGQPAFVIGENRTTSSIPNASELQAPSADGFAPRTGKAGRRPMPLTKSAEKALAGAQ